MEEETIGWKGELIKCDLCSYSWTAVYHQSCDHLQCPNCKFMTVI